ncbi:hypothetical protein [Streptomyces gardneri]|uniref:hypothetical protein n=1 Tax=Streptomyces gardneri TaxID=66892 RepID=UPI0035D58722
MQDTVRSLSGDIGALSNLMASTVEQITDAAAGASGAVEKSRTGMEASVQQHLSNVAGHTGVLLERICENQAAQVQSAAELEMRVGRLEGTGQVVTM